MDNVDEEKIMSLLFCTLGYFMYLMVRSLLIMEDDGTWYSSWSTIWILHIMWHSSEGDGNEHITLITHKICDFVLWPNWTGKSQHNVGISKRKEEALLNMFISFFKHCKIIDLLLLPWDTGYKAQSPILHVVPPCEIIMMAEEIFPNVCDLHSRWHGATTGKTGFL